MKFILIYIFLAHSRQKCLVTKLSLPLILYTTFILNSNCHRNSTALYFLVFFSFHLADLSPHRTRCKVTNRGGPSLTCTSNYAPISPIRTRKSKSKKKQNNIIHLPRVRPRKNIPESLSVWWKNTSDPVNSLRILLKWGINVSFF